MTTMPGEKSLQATRNSLIVTKIAQFIVKMNVAPLPRNYEMFYEVLTGQNHAMGRDILALGNAPQQHDLDLIGQKHNLPGFSRIAAVQAAGQATEVFEQIAAHLNAAVTRTGALMSSLSSSPDQVRQLLSELQAEQSSLQNFIQQGLVKIREQDSQSVQIQEKSLRDALTALPNRAAFLEKLTNIFSGDNGPAPTALVIVNIDRFREINDAYGPVAGNKALRRLAALFRKSIKNDDFVARIDGNEFAFLFPGVAASTAHSIADRLRRTVQDMRFSTIEGNVGQLTVCMGVAASEGTATPAEFYGRAELALLSARGGQRNRVIVYAPELSKRSRASYVAAITT